VPAIRSAPPAVILAAGQGARIGSPLPKPLTPLRGHSLLERTVTSLSLVGVQEVWVTVGHRATEVAAHAVTVGQTLGVSVHPVEVPGWERGNGASALAVAEHIGDRPFFLLMADHLIEPTILERLLSEPPGPDEVCLAVDRDLDGLFDVPDVTKVRTRADGSFEAIGKELEDWDAADTGVFLCTPALFRELAAAGARNRHQLSHAMARLAHERRARAVDATGCRWLDVDTPEALHEAEAWLDAVNAGTP